MKFIHFVNRITVKHVNFKRSVDIEQMQFVGDITVQVERVLSKMGVVKTESWHDYGFRNGSSYEVDGHKLLLEAKHELWDVSTNISSEDAKLVGEVYIGLIENQ